jgi:pyruvate/2-oxoacid:ferredoxin oxidoreductase alpha subunit
MVDHLTSASSWGGNWNGGYASFAAPRGKGFSLKKSSHRLAVGNEVHAVAALGQGFTCS